MGKGDRSGFTLIELSIVLVILGLLVGGILVGRDLIDAAAIRAQISQIEKYNTAVNTFRLKYGYLPGDIPDPAATSVGLTHRGTVEGEGDGNDILEGMNSGGTPSGAKEGMGETVTFWVDLSTVGLIPGGFNTATETTDPGTVSGSAIARYFPAAAIGNDNYVWVASFNKSWLNIEPANYYMLTQVTKIYAVAYTQTGLTVAQAFAIDNKVDDGQPMTGRVSNIYLNQYNLQGSANGTTAPCTGPRWNSCGSVPATAITCYDNGNGTAEQWQYSMSFNDGAGINCALSFQMQ